MRKYLHPLTISFILIGLLLGYCSADYGYDPNGLWNKYYYAWDKGKDILLSLCIVYPAKAYKAVWVLIGGFFLVRWVWQFFAIRDYASANRISVIFGLFLVEILLICIITLYPQIKKLIKWHRLR